MQRSSPTKPLSHKKLMPQSLQVCHAIVSKVFRDASADLQPNVWARGLASLAGIRHQLAVRVAPSIMLPCWRQPQVVSSNW